MRGRKKTKWRKLPLEEFTSDWSKFGKSSNETKSDSARKENTSYPDIVEENFQSSSNEYVENSDGLWYPTQYLIYNPVEVPVYPPNYMMPADTNCYYFPSSDIEYTGVPYQECMPPMKDTVYLLFPASALRPTQYSSYDWRNKRRRRRYNGYAEYAVIPEKSNIDDKFSEKKGTTLVKSFGKAEKNGTEVQTAQKQRNQNSYHILDDKCELINIMGLSKSERNEESSHKQKKVVDVCGVHSKALTQDSKSDSTKKDLPNHSSDFKAICMEKESNKVPRFESNSPEIFPNEEVLAEKMDNLNCNPMKNDNDVIRLEKSNDKTSTMNDEHKVNEESFMESKDACLENADQINFNQSSLPNIISAVPITPHIDEITVGSSLLNNDRTQNSLHSAKNINDRVSKIPSVSAAQSAYLPYLYNINSDVLSVDNKHTDVIATELPPLNTANSIYKLAFDESLTDHSDTESRSPSPIVQYPVHRNPIDRNSIDRCSIDHESIDPESHVPSSLINNEINIYEADSGDDAGSEDLELIPHRYESESFLNKSKHLYENKLSLAVELLRTKESLPYDAQFKRVIEESQEYVKTESTGEVNMAFIEDLNSLDSKELKSNYCVKSDLKTITNQCKTKNSPKYDIPLDDTLSNSYELADEANLSVDYQGEEMNAGYRRFGFRHYFSPTLVNPWNCCIIM